VENKACIHKYALPLPQTIQNPHKCFFNRFAALRKKPVNRMFDLPALNNTRVPC
jgi:hypothetical protein